MMIPSILKKGFLTSLVTLMATVLFTLSANAQDQGSQIQEQAPAVFLDCTQWCFEDYLRSNITFVNFVRDQADSQIHLMINQAQTGGGGSQYTLTFIGREEFSAINDTLVYSSAQSDTQDEERSGLARNVRLGLAQYIAQTPLYEYADFTLEGMGEDEESGQQVQQQDDPWNNWIFEIELDGSMDGEERESAYEISGGFNASRVTEDWKIELETSYDYEEETFELRDDGETREVTSTTSNQSFEGLVVRSLNDHWSIGINTEIGSSTFQNLDFELSGSPAIEYNIFPYREYNEREFIFRYEISPTYNKYSETTIFGEDEEFLLRQELLASLEVTQTWGEISASLEGSNYMHDFSQNRLEFGASVEFRIFRGLDLELSGNYDVINDQLTLPADDITDEEALLRQRQQATSYEFGVSMGISYTFGSIFNNVVNPRFDAGGGGGGGGGFGGGGGGF